MEAFMASKWFKYKQLYINGVRPSATKTDFFWKILRSTKTLYIKVGLADLNK